MNRRIILVAFNWTRDKDPRIPLGHASLLASLQTVPLLDIRSVVISVNQGGSSPEHIVEVLLAHADAPPAHVDIAFGAYVWGEELLRAVLPILRRRGFCGRIILGGPQVSYSGPGLEFIYPQADAFVRGYGEHALTALVQAPGRPAITGVHYSGQRDRCEQAQIDLETIPSPWLTGTLPVESGRLVRFETQRGCPFRCAFCQHREAGSQLRPRELSTSRALEEVALFCRHGVAEIAVLDPIFNATPRAQQILRALAAGGFGGRVSLQCRAELVTAEFLDAAQLLDTSLEFGLQTIHAAEGEAIDRKNHVEKVDRALSWVRDRGIAHEVSLIFGLPEQALSSFLASVQWCLQRRVPVIKAFPLMLLRGTPLEQKREQWKLRERGSSMPFVIASNSFDEGDWTQMARIAECLALTHGKHPTSLEELLRLAASCEPDLARWQPAPLEMAA